MNIGKLLQERGKIHGDAKTTHTMAMDLWNLTVDESKLTSAGQAMLFLIMVKIARAVQHPEHADHWDDIAGYAALIKKCECK